MLQRVSYLNIKPLEPYKGQGHGKTTLTKFDDVLSGQQAAQATPASSSNTSTDNTSSSSAESNIVFKDPVSGKPVQYVDVSKETDTAKETEKTKNTQTTSASSMKKTKYDAYFKEAAAKYDVPESLLKAVAKAESNFNAKDVSGSGAMGVMQLMPATAKSLGVKDPFDARQNIMGGAKCLKQKLKEFNGDLRLALAAYNAGSGAVKRNGGVPSYCKSYVNKVLSYKKAYETAVSVG